MLKFTCAVFVGISLAAAAVAPARADYDEAKSKAFGATAGGQAAGAKLPATPVVGLSEASTSTSRLHNPNRIGGCCIDTEGTGKEYGRLATSTFKLDVGAGTGTSLPIFGLEYKSGSGKYSLVTGADGKGREEASVDYITLKGEHDGGAGRSAAAVVFGVEGTSTTSKDGTAKAVTLDGPLAPGAARDKTYFQIELGGTALKSGTHVLAIAKVGREVAICTPLDSANKNLICANLTASIAVGTQLGIAGSMSATYNRKIDGDADHKRYVYVGTSLTHAGTTDFVSDTSGQSMTGLVNIGVATY